ncbi:MAG: AraC family transcriptional regulator [Pyrinomonadaceae bacterium]
MQNKILQSSNFALYLHRGKHLNWSAEAITSYYLFLPFKGTIVMHCEDHEFQAANNEALLINPGSIVNVSSKQIEYIAVSLAPAFIIECAAQAQMIRAESIITFNTSIIRHDRRLFGLAQDIIDEIRSSKIGKVRVIQSLIELLTLHLLRHYSQVKYAPGIELSRAGLVDRRIRRAVELMHTHLDQNLSVDQMAEAAYLSPFHFSRLFKKIAGISPHAYLGVLRNERARTLLADQNLSITEVCVRVGYSSPSHFTKAFRAATGMTPREFRRALIT